MSQSHRRSFPASCIMILILIVIIGAALLWIGASIPEMAQRAFGSPSPRLSFIQRFQYSSQLLLRQEEVINPVNPAGVPIQFSVDAGESVNSIGYRLEQQGLATSAEAFRQYLIYAGLDTNLQAGNYEISPAWNIIEIAAHLQDATPAEVIFAILPGWRAEEIAASLPTTGLQITPMDFLDAVRNPKEEWKSALGITTGSLEGFLFPGEYSVLRETDINGLMDLIISGFNKNLTEELKLGFDLHGLSLYEAVTLASIVQREAVVPDEGPMIASVFYNRLASGMKLDSDPTVQYAVGYNSRQLTWWTNPLSFDDLATGSIYNTYIYAGLPPGPISNPGLAAYQSVAAPAESPYFYFRARCDGSGYHNFAVTFEEHLQNGCE